MRLRTYDTVLDKNKHTVLLLRDSFNYPQEEKLNTPSKIHRMMCDVFHVNYRPLK